MNSAYTKIRRVAVLDACVIYPFMLRDLCMWLIVEKAFYGKWTEEIHSEWIRNVLKKRPEISKERLQATRERMDKWAPNALVVGHEYHISNLSLPDENDRHVLAAAIESKAEYIVTFDLKDFPPENLNPFHVTAMHPDDFMLMLFQDDQDVFIKGVREHRLSLKKPPINKENYPALLENQRLPKTAALLKDLEF